MQIAIGDVVEGKVTGIQPYGAFVQLDDSMYGLIHISEISSGFVSNISSFMNVGDTVRCKVIDVDMKTNQARLSLKALNTTHRRRRMNPHYRKPLKMKIGFKSIEEKLPEWVKEELQEIEKYD